MIKQNEATFKTIRKLKELIYDLAQFENIKTTFPETEAIIDGAKLENVDEVDVYIINGLKNAWLKLISEEHQYIDPEFIKEINSIVGKNLVLNAGEYRTKSIGVGEVEELIQPINQEEWIDNIQSLNNIEYPLERAINFLVFSITSQPFWDGNKRTAFLAANSVLISNNIGVLSIDKNHLIEFNVNLNKYYNNCSDENLNNLLQTLKKSIDYTEEYLKRN
ncbi:Fic family protein [Mesoplasma lactucae]|uniref:Fido domain-containing protein n=1 Tax=Mesoplasma lactucae ATCC 49193 TaxID=81460 RepID=A0A291IQU2_9MOLU|nr:Fic family protein [Mesoplasma lactucae]ATG97222.1 hypothetical protein CP520_00385 [Mesoplasma lactucae ATCC 49193]